MAHKHPAHYLFQSQLILLVVLVVVSLVSSVERLLFPLGLSMVCFATILSGVTIISRVGRRKDADYYYRHDMMHGSSLPQRIYCPESID